MSMTQKQKNIALAMQQVGTTILSLQHTIDFIAIQYVDEGMTDLVDADWAELTEFAGVTANEANVAKNALNAISTTLGDGSAGTNAKSILRITNTVP